MLILKQDIIVAVRVKGRVKVDEINAFVNKILTENIEVVAIKQGVSVIARAIRSPFQGIVKNNSYSAIVHENIDAWEYLVP